jgi:ParB family chromosome partitioning protein
VSKRALKSPDTLALERRVSDALGLAVTVDHRGNGGVLQITIELDQPDDVLRRLSKN